MCNPSAKCAQCATTHSIQAFASPRRLHSTSADASPNASSAIVTTPHYSTPASKRLPQVTLNLQLVILREGLDCMGRCKMSLRDNNSQKKHFNCSIFVRCTHLFTLDTVVQGCVAADMRVCKAFAKWSANQIENSLIGRERGGAQADADQECSEWEACMHPPQCGPGSGLQFRGEKWDGSGLLRAARPDASLPGAAELMQLLMQLVMQITTALYLAITLSSFDASSLFQTWQNQRERDTFNPPKKTRSWIG